MPPSHWSEPFESDMVGRRCGGSAKASWGAGDVAGVLSVKGLSENVSDDGLDPIEDGGKDMRVPFGEPSGVKMAGRSVVADVHVNLLCELRSRGAVRWVSRVMLDGCTVGGGVILMVGTVGSRFAMVLGFELGTRFAVLGSGFWKTARTKLRRVDRVGTAPITTWIGGLEQESK